VLDTCCFVDEETGAEMKCIGTRDLAAKLGIPFVVIDALLV